MNRLLLVCFASLNLLSVMNHADAMDVSILNRGIKKYSLDVEMARVQCMTEDEIVQYKPDNKKSQFSLGTHYIILFEGSQKDSDLELAKFWFTKSKEQGYGRAYCNLMKLYMSIKDLIKQLR